MRTTLYHRDNVWGSQQRGTLESSSCRRILARELQTRGYSVNRNQLSNAKDKRDQMRVGASFYVFLNMLDEGLTYISCVQNEMFDGKCNVTLPLMSLFYANDAIEIFHTLVVGLLHDKNICNAYRIASTENVDRLWKVLTPEAASGAEATFVNLAIIPRTVQHADLEGNLQDDGRRNVALTRSRLFTSTHVSAESLQDSNSPVFWERYNKQLIDKTYLGKLEVVHCHKDDTNLGKHTVAWFAQKFGASTFTASQCKNLEKMRTRSYWTDCVTCRKLSETWRLSTN